MNHEQKDRSPRSDGEKTATGSCHPVQLLDLYLPCDSGDKPAHWCPELTSHLEIPIDTGFDLTDVESRRSLCLAVSDWISGFASDKETDQNHDLFAIEGLLPFGGMLIVADESGTEMSGAIKGIMKSVLTGEEYFEREAKQLPVVIVEQDAAPSKDCLGLSDGNCANEESQIEGDEQEVFVLSISPGEPIWSALIQIAASFDGAVQPLVVINRLESFLPPAIRDDEQARARLVALLEWLARKLGIPICATISAAIWKDASTHTDCYFGFQPSSGALIVAEQSAATRCVQKLFAYTGGVSEPMELGLSFDLEAVRDAPSDPAYEIARSLIAHLENQKPQD